MTHEIIFTAFSVNLKFIWFSKYTGLNHVPLKFTCNCDLRTWPYSEVESLSTKSCFRWWHTGLQEALTQWLVSLEEEEKTEMEKRKSRDTQGRTPHERGRDGSNTFTSQNHQALPAATSSRGHGTDSPLEPPVGTNQPWGHPDFRCLASWTRDRINVCCFKPPRYLLQQFLGKKWIQ